jgi:hydroxymethylbilane synthase
MLRVATAQLQPSTSDSLQQFLLQHDLPHTFSNMDTDALLRGDVDTVVVDWSNAPLDLPEHFVWAALSPRTNAALCLLIRRESMVLKLDFRLPQGAKVALAAVQQQVQLLDYRPDFVVVPLSVAISDALIQLAEGEYDAVLLDPEQIHGLAIDETQLTRLELHPSEIVPRAGQGVLGFLAMRDDLETRRLLRTLHHPPTGHCCNVERQVLRLAADIEWGKTLSVYCTQDQAGNYHVWATAQQGETLGRAQLSNSTFLGLAERIFARLAENM